MRRQTQRPFGQSDGHFSGRKIQHRIERIFEAAALRTAEPRSPNRDRAVEPDQRPGLVAFVPQFSAVFRKRGRGCGTASTLA